MSISAIQVKELRDRSGVGMMDCKKALVESGGDIDSAFDILRKSGIAKAQKKAGRAAKEGLILSDIDSGTGILLEINCETDFVAKTSDFIELCKNILEHIKHTKSTKVEEVLKENFLNDSNKKVKDILTEIIGKLGENIILSGFCKFELESNGLMTSYIHPGSKLGVLLELNCETDSVANTDDLKELGRDISMHIAATNPICVNIEEVSEEILNKEKEIYFEQAKKQNKPDNIIEKMVEGRVQKFYKESVLLKQEFVKDPNKTISDLIAEANVRLGENIVVSRFSRFQLGDKQ